MRARNGRHRMRPSSVATPAVCNVATKAARTKRPVSSSLLFASRFETPDEEDEEEERDEEDEEEDRHESHAAAVPGASICVGGVSVDDAAAAAVDNAPDATEDADADAEDEDDTTDAEDDASDDAEDETAVGAFIIARMRSPPTRCSSDVTDGADTLLALSAAADDDDDDDDDDDASRAGVFEDAAATAEDEEWAEEAEAEEESTWSVSFHASMRVSCASRLRRMRSIRNLKRRSSAS